MSEFLLGFCVGALAMACAAIMGRWAGDYMAIRRANERPERQRT